MIEFFVLKFFLESIDDYLFEKSLEQAIPDLHLLYEDPQEVLKSRDIVIGPRRRYCSAAFGGLIWGLVSAGSCYLLFSVLPRLLGLPQFRKELYWAIVITVGVGSFLLAIQKYRGGYCALTRRGAEFKYLGKTIRCPWVVFDAPGHPAFDAVDNWLLLPISPRSTLVVEEINSKSGIVLSFGLQIQTPQWRSLSSVNVPRWFISDSDDRLLVEVKHLYEVNPLRLAELLLHLGRMFGSLQKAEVDSSWRADLSLSDNQKNRVGKN
jgi:hypothetical protein